MNTQTAPSLLEARDITVSYGRARAVHGIDLDCTSFSTTAIVGPNGAGKSSLLHALVGSLRSIGGSVALRGETVDELDANARASRGIALVPQGRHVFKSLTVKENLAVIADSLRLSRSTIDTALDRFPILRDRHRILAGLLSGGEQQMLAIARALMAEPSVLLLDEPALGLAPAIVDDLMATVSDVARDGAAVVITEPSTASLRVQIDRGFVMQRGRFVADADGDSLTTVYHQALGMETAD